MSLGERKSLIDAGDEGMSIRNQCGLLGINRSSLYYKPIPLDEETIKLMNLLDEHHTKTPFYGVRKMTEVLKRAGYNVGKDRVRNLLRQMGLIAVYPKRNTSKRAIEHKIYPYLLNMVEIMKPNHVWFADITYIRLMRGFAYLVAIMDWFSRYVLSWRLSNSLDADFCIEALAEALKYGKSEIFNTDQGSQFTSDGFTGLLLNNNISISMDSRGRMYDNIFVERLWRTVKYEDVYLKGYETIQSTCNGLKDYFNFYNNERLHQSLEYRTPWEVYSGIAFYNPLKNDLKKIMV